MTLNYIVCMFSDKGQKLQEQMTFAINIYTLNYGKRKANGR